MEISGMARPGNVAGYEALAQQKLPRAVYDYYAGGAEDETTVRANRAAFERYTLRPRVLVDVSNVDMTTRVGNDDVAFPVLLAPAAFQQLADPAGEAATARAAASAGTILVASSLSNHSIEDIAAAAPGALLWLQLYVFRDRSITEELVRRAERAGCRAICLTASVPVQGNRERDVHNRFSLPPDLEMGNFRGLSQARMPLAQGSGLLAFIGKEFDPTLSWDALAWLRSITSLPIWLKGVMTAADARLAHEHGAAGVIVSNHGGRQLDGAEPSLYALPHIMAAVGDRMPVLMDGGVRRGTDVVKALLLGARAVMIARPYLWGLAVGGEAGVTHVLEILRDEARRTLALLGAPSLQRLDGSLLAER